MTLEHKMIRETVRSFAEKEIKPLAIQLDEAEQFDIDLTKQMADLGLFGMTASEKYGGQELDTVSYIIAVEELARVDASQAATVAVSNSLGIGMLETFGSEEQKHKYLPTLCKGDGLWSFGLTELGAGSDAGGTKTTAKLDGNEWVINGSKIFITNASTELSMGVTITAKTGENEISCFLVEKDTPGYEAHEMKGKMMWRASNTSELYFDDCRIPKENLLGNCGDGFKQMLKILDDGRLSIAAMGLGGAQGCFDLAKKYADEREQFGKPISHFQANAFKFADMSTEIEHARLFLYYACDLKDAGEKFTKEAAMTKLYCSELMGRCADHTVQLHGGYGLMKEYHIERFYRDQKLLDIGEGTSEIMRLVIARNL